MRLPTYHGVRQQSSLFRGSRDIDSNVEEVLNIKIKKAFPAKQYNLSIQSAYENPKMPQPGEVIYKATFPEQNNSDKEFKNFLTKKVKNLEEFL